MLKMANAEGFAVVPRGAGSGFTGGSVPIEGGVVISTERMTGIEIDEDNLVATVGSGVITGDLQDEVEKLGLFYPPDPTSRKFSSIGGNISEGAGGPRAVKYGTTRDYVLALEVVLPQGEIISTGVKTMKGVVGYDLTRLMVGAEGTLGIVTKAALRLVPLPKAVKTMYAAYSSLEDAARAVSGIIKARIIPSALELIDSASLRCVEASADKTFQGVDAILLIEVDGTDASVSDEAQAIEDVCVESGSVEFKAATEKAEKKRLWKIRSDISPSLFKLKPTKLNEDIVVPRSRLVELLSGVGDISKDRDVLIACFGHAGDGNIHVNVMVNREDRDEAERGKAAVGDLMKLTLSLGGTISGEHGVGITKAPYLSMEVSEGAIDAMKRLKYTLDPNGVLNPGKIFTVNKR